MTRMNYFFIQIRFHFGFPFQSASADDAQNGLAFMQEMIELAKRNGEQGGLLQRCRYRRIFISHFINSAIQATRVVQPLTSPFYGYVSLPASPAQFGPESDDFDVAI